MKRNVNRVEYPAVTLTVCKSKSFYFNAIAAMYITGPYVRVSRAKLHGEPVLCFRGADIGQGYSKHKCNKGGGFEISANTILNDIGLLCCKNLNIRSRRCYPIDDGVAIKIYE